MHVALNALSITNRSGTGRYAWGLIHGMMTELGGNDRLSVVIPASFTIPNEWRRNDKIRFYSIPIRSALRRIVWEQGSLPSFVKQIQGDILHSPAFIAPVLRRTNVKQIVTIHDLAFARFPRTIPLLRLAFYRWAIPASIRRADSVITDSRTIADELAQTAYAPKRIVPIHLGVDPSRFRSQTSPGDESVMGRYDLRNDYFLFVGTREPRKNLHTLLNAYSQARERGLNTELVIAGRLGWMQDEAAFGNPGVRTIDHVANDAIPALYRHTKALLAPSLYEGFDLPVVEAIACGAPVIASDIPTHREILDPNTNFIPVKNVYAWAQALIDCEKNPPVVPTKRIRGWSETAADTFRVYRSVYSSIQSES